LVLGLTGLGLAVSGLGLGLGLAFFGLGLGLELYGLVNITVEAQALPRLDKLSLAYISGIITEHL